MLLEKDLTVTRHLPEKKTRNSKITLIYSIFAPCLKKTEFLQTKNIALN